MATPQTLDRCYAQDVADTLGTYREVISALVVAERRGAATVNGVIITHTGYAAGATVFAAETAEYRLTWET